MGKGMDHFRLAMGGAYQEAGGPAVLQGVVPVELKAQIGRGAAVGLFGLLGAAATAAFIVFGPELEGNAVLAAVAVLASCLFLVLIALVATCGPLVSYIALERVKSIRSSLDSMEAQEEAERIAEDMRALMNEIDAQGPSGEMRLVLAKYRRRLR
jgi:hypothetical protein